MRLFYFLIFLLVTLLVQCDNTTDFDKGPCKFAPPESNFPLVDQSCTECYFNLSFQGSRYVFQGNKIFPSFGGDYSKMRNAFFDFYLDSPDSDEELNASIDVKTPIVKVENITKSTGTPPVVSTAFGIYNYCNDFFQPITDDVNRSFHRLTKSELIESYTVKIDSEPHQLFIFYLTGEIHATIIINDETQVITAEYQLKSFIFEKL